MSERYDLDEVLPTIYTMGYIAAVEDRELADSGKPLTPAMRADAIAASVKRFETLKPETEDGAGGPTDGKEP